MTGKLNLSKSLRLAVLQTGRSIDEAIEEHGDYDEMCKALMLRGPTEADTFPVLEGVFPSSLEPYDVFIITGSKHGVYEDHDWLAPLESMIRDIFAANKKLIGICFGHQIIAKALGGEVAKSDRGFGVGVMDYQITDGRGVKNPIALYAWHQDQILTPPPNAETIASSDFCKYAGLRYGDCALTFQPHPEFTSDYVRLLAEARRGAVINEVQADAAIASLQRDVDAELVQAMIFDFVNQ